MEKEIAAYLAGIVDGEGSICIVERPAKPQCGEVTPTFLDFVKIGNTDYRLLAWISEKTGLGTIYTETRRKPNSRQMHAWHVSSKQCVKFLERVHPYLVIKKEQAALIFSFRETFEPVGTGRRVSEETLALRRWHCAEMKRLHRKVEQAYPSIPRNRNLYDGDPGKWVSF